MGQRRTWRAGGRPGRRTRGCQEQAAARSRLPPRKGKSRTGREAARMNAEAGCVWVISRQFWCPRRDLTTPSGEFSQTGENHQGVFKRRPIWGVFTDLGVRGGLEPGNARISPIPPARPAHIPNTGSSARPLPDLLQPYDRRPGKTTPAPPPGRVPRATAGQALACPLFLPPGAVGAPGSRPTGRPSPQAMRSSLEDGGTAPYRARHDQETAAAKPPPSPP
jgi:hypothetical protein